VGEDAAHEGRQPRQVEVLDHLHQHDGVVTGQPVVAVGRRRLQQLEAGPLGVRHALQVEPPGRQLEGPVGDVDAEDLAEGGIGDELAQQGSLPAAEVDHGGGAFVAQRCHDGRRAQPRQRRRPACRLGAVDEQRLALGVVHLGQPADGVLHQASGGGPR
jgi:hypothetical protein